MTVTIRAGYREQAILALAKLAKRGKKVGADVSFTFGEIYTVTVKEYSEVTGRTREVKKDYIDIEVSDAPVQLAGWEFLARVEFLNGQCLLNHVPGKEEDLPEQYRTADQHCDYCKSDRRRKDVFVVRNIESGQYQQVGRDCLRDFLGTDSPESILARFRFYASLSFSDMDEDFGGGRRDPMTPLATVIETATLIIERTGEFVPTSSYEFSTRDAVCMFLYDNTKEGNDYRNRIKGELSEEGKKAIAEKADAVTEWVRSMEADNDYLRNLKVVFSGDYVSLKHFGIAVSAPKAYDRAMSYIERKKREEEAKAGKPMIDAPEGRVEVAGKVLSIKEQTSDFGEVYKMLVDDPRGFRVWCTVPSNLLNHLSKGHDVRLTVTLKRSEKDNSFAFGSRPTKAVIIKEEAEVQ